MKMVDYRDVSTHSFPRHQIEVTGHPHTTAALRTEEEVWGTHLVRDNVGITSDLVTSKDKHYFLASDEKQKPFFGSSICCPNRYTHY
jgi:hypothetical protein